MFALSKTNNIIMFTPVAGSKEPYDGSSQKPCTPACPVPSHVIPFEKWYTEHYETIDGIIDTVVKRIYSYATSDVAVCVDADKLAMMLAKRIYKTSNNRFKSFPQ